MIDAGASGNGCLWMGGFVLHNHRENSNIWMWTFSPHPPLLAQTGFARSHKSRAAVHFHENLTAT